MATTTTPKPPLRVVFQGVPGAYSDAAARELLNLSALDPARVTITGLASFEACFDAVTKGEAEYACLPMENTMGGSVFDNFDLQLKNSLHSVAEIHFPVRHCLLALPGQTKQDIKTVISHPQALSQCAEYIRREMPWAKVKPESDTAGSAQMIADQKLAGYAAVASATAAEVYKLNTLDEDIQDAKDNVTRFLLYSREPVDAARAAQAGFKLKASIVFTIGNRAGALHHAIEPFARHKLNMTKLESRPDRRRGESSTAIIRDGGAMTYLFGKDFLGDLPKEPTGPTEEGTGELEFKAMFFLDFVLSAGTREAIRELAALSPYFRVLGVYAADGLLIGHVADALGCTEGTSFARGKKRPTPSPSSSSEVKKSRLSAATSLLTIAVIGFGNFGQFLSKQMRSHGHHLLAWSRSQEAYLNVAAELEVELYKDMQTMFQSNPQIDVVLVATSILSFENIIQELEKANLLRGKLVVDVLSVKTHAKKVLLNAFPDDDVDILCTHPMFGPESGKHTWRNLPFVFEKVRINNKARCEEFLNIFARSGCSMVELTCEEHDAKAANSQFITHFTGRALNELKLSRTGIDTKGFISLLDLVENTCKDSDDLFLALYRHNPNAASTLDSIRLAVDGVAYRLKTSSESPNKIVLSECVNRVAPSKTVKTHSLAMELVASGKDVVTTLTVGEPNFGPPEEALLAAERCLRDPKGTKYTSVSGTIELRRAIAQDYLKRKGVSYDPAKQILVSGGGKQSVYQAVNALCGPDDEVIIPSPFWVSYPDICRLAGAKPVIVRREASSGFILSPEQLEKAITKRTRMLILCNPCNPTGCMYSKEQLEALAKVLERHPKVFVLADEIYERIIFPDAGEHVSFASLSGMKDRTLIVNGVAKGFAMTGMRIGWLCGPETIVKAAEKLQSQINSSACSVSQAAAAAALPLDPKVAGPGPDNLNSLLRNRDVGYELLKSIPGVTTVKGGGAFYFFVSIDPAARPKGLTCEKLCEYLIRREKGVAMVPGDAFGETPESCSFRISYACSEKDLREGIQRFRDGLEELRKQSTTSV